MFHGINSAIYKQTCTLRVCKSDILISLTMFCSENCSRISCWTKYENKHNVLIYIQQDATLHSLFYLEIAVHVSGATITHHQKRKQLYLQYLVFVTPLLLPAAIVEELELLCSSNSSTIAAASSNGMTNTRCCRYSCMRSWWWVEVPPETCKQFPDISKLCKVASC